MRIASGGIRHETNTFSVTPTTLADMDWMILWDNVYKEFYGEDISDFMLEPINTTQFIRED
ncbi:M81 family metallopeptidase [Chloroflexi bacterium]|nr:M81 family metallopeptidase [Chloroflexota bacterium]